MNAASKIEAGGLSLLREPFPAHQISKLPKPTKAQTDAVKADFKKGIRCSVCGSWHHPDVVHLDYVGHAALTDRLLDADPEWSWEPMGTTPEGLPALSNGLWIKLTVCGVSRYGYGSADGKTGGDAIKEMIGDALRNAAMRFGAALDLWHKGDLHVSGEEAPEGAVGDNADNGAVSPDGPKPRKRYDGPIKTPTALKAAVHEADRVIRGCGDIDELDCYLATPEFVALKKQLHHEEPKYLYGGDDLPEEFEPLKDLVERYRSDFQNIRNAADFVRAG